MRVLRCNSELNQLHFHDRLLTEAVQLTGAGRGFILRVQSRQYFPVTYHGFGKAPSQHPDYASAGHLAQEAIRKGRSVLLATGSSGVREDSPDTNDSLEIRFRLKSLSQHSILVVPFMTNERIFGGVYLDKPVGVGQFVARNQVLLEAFAQHAAVALYNRREFEAAIREPLTGFYTASYFIERLREAYRWFNLHGKSFTLLGFFVPTLDDMLGEGKAEQAAKLAQDLSEVLPLRAAVSWGSPVLCILLSEADVAVEKEIAVRVRQRLETTFGQKVPMETLPAHSRYQHGAEIYFEMRRRLVPAVSDEKVLGELRGLLTKDINLRDAKRILERHKIESALRKTGGNITHAARDLGIHRPQLSNLLKKYSLRREVFENGLEVRRSEREPGL
jgi:transcriptional regulator with GAF, ATPase, and Fis domain